MSFRLLRDQMALAIAGGIQLCEIQKIPLDYSMNAENVNTQLELYVQHYNGQLSLIALPDDQDAFFEFIGRWLHVQPSKCLQLIANYYYSFTVFEHSIGIHGLVDSMFRLGEAQILGAGDITMLFVGLKNICECGSEALELRRIVALCQRYVDMHFEQKPVQLAEKASSLLFNVLKERDMRYQITPDINRQLQILYQSLIAYFQDAELWSEKHRFFKNMIRLVGLLSELEVNVTPEAFTEVLRQASEAESGFEPEDIECIANIFLEYMLPKANTATLHWLRQQMSALMVCAARKNTDFAAFAVSFIDSYGLVYQCLVDSFLVFGRAEDVNALTKLTCDIVQLPLICKLCSLYSDVKDSIVGVVQYVQQAVEQLTTFLAQKQV